MKIACKTSDITSERDYNGNPEFKWAILDDPSYLIKKLTFTDPYPDNSYRFMLMSPEIVEHYSEFDTWLSDSQTVQVIIRQKSSAVISEIELGIVWQI